jgi:hypothetical protein
MLTNSKTIRFTKQQKEALDTLEKYNVNVSQFIRIAISEKIKKDWKSIKETKEKVYCPF